MAQFRIAFYKHLLVRIIGLLLLAFIYSSPADAARQDIDTIIKTANATAEMGDYSGAIRMLDEALRTGKNRRILLTAQANTYFIQKKYDEATEICLKVLKEDPRYDWPMLILAKSYFAKKDYPKAKQQIEELKSFVQNSDILYELTLMEAEILRAQKQYHGAEEASNRAIQIKNDQLPGYELRALNFRLLGKIKESEAELLKALKATPQDPRLLEILADHYRDRRHYTKMWEYLKQATEACGDISKCQRFNDVYHEDYFINTGLHGYDLSSVRIPMSASLENEYTSEFSNTENMLRALKNIKGDHNNENLLPPHKATPKNIVRLAGNLLLPHLPLLHLRADYDHRFNEKDPLVEHITEEYRVEAEKTLHLPLLGETTLFPYFKYTFLDGSDFSVVDIFAGKFQINEYTFALRSLSQPSFGRWYVEPEYAFSIGDFRHSKRTFTEHRGSLRIGRVYEDQSRIVLSSQYYYAGHSTHNNDLRLVQDALVEKFIFNGKLMVWTNQSLIFHKDYRFENRNLNTFIYKPTFGLKIFPKEPLNFQTAVGHFLGDSYHEYDHLDFDFQVAYRMDLRFHKKLEGQRLAYTMPFEFVVGYKSEYLYHYPKPKGKWLDTVYALIRLAR